MRIPALLLVSTTLASMAFVPAPEPKPVSGQVLKRLQGTWNMAFYAKEGRPVLEHPELMQVVISGDRMTYTHCGTKVSEWALVPSPGKNATTMEMKGLGNLSGEVILCVYRVKGDSLTLCHSDPGMGLPADMDGTKPGRWMEILQRARQ